MWLKVGLVIFLVVGILMGCANKASPANIPMMEPSPSSAPLLADTLTPSATASAEPTASPIPTPEATATFTAVPTHTPAPTVPPTPGAAGTPTPYVLWEYSVRDINGDVIRITEWSDGHSTKEIVPPTPTPTLTPTPTPTTKQLCGSYVPSRYYRHSDCGGETSAKFGGTVDLPATNLCPGLAVMVEIADSTVPYESKLCVLSLDTEHWIPPGKLVYSVNLDALGGVAWNLWLVAADGTTLSPKQEMRRTWLCPSSVPVSTYLAALNFERESK